MTVRSLKFNLVMLLFKYFFCNTISTIFVTLFSQNLFILMLHQTLQNWLMLNRGYKSVRHNLQICFFPVFRRRNTSASYWNVFLGTGYMQVKIWRIHYELLPKPERSTGKYVWYISREKRKQFTAFSISLAVRWTSSTEMKIQQWDHEFHINKVVRCLILSHSSLVLEHNCVNLDN